MSQAVNFTKIDREHVNRIAGKFQADARERIQFDALMSTYLVRKIFEPSYNQSILEEGLVVKDNLVDLAQKHKIDLVEKLEEIQKEFYSPNNMYLVIWSKDNLDYLTQVVADNFGLIPKFQVSATKNTSNLSTHKQTGFAIKFATYQPYNRRLTVSFFDTNNTIIPKTIFLLMDYCRLMTKDYLLQEYLKNQSLSSLVSDQQKNMGNPVIYGLEFFITQFGTQKIDLILNYTFQRINAVKKCMNDNWRNSTSDEETRVRF